MCREPDDGRYVREPSSGTPLCLPSQEGAMTYFEPSSAESPSEGLKGGAEARKCVRPEPEVMRLRADVPKFKCKKY